jgi:hypothetical protein
MAAHSANDRAPAPSVARSRKWAAIGWLRLSQVLLMAILVVGCAPPAVSLPAPTTIPAPTAVPPMPTTAPVATAVPPPSPQPPAPQPITAPASTATLPIVRECEYPDEASIGEPISRSGASGSKVHGQFGITTGTAWSARPGYVQYNISTPQSDLVYLTLRYSKYSPSSASIRIYIDGEANPRAAFQPIDQGSWDRFVWSEPITLGSVGTGPHTLRFVTDGQQYGVADLDAFVLSSRSLLDAPAESLLPSMAVYSSQPSEVSVTPIWDSTQTLCADNQSYMRGSPGTYLYRKTSEHGQSIYFTQHPESSEGFSDAMKNAPPGMTSSLPHTSSTDFVGVQIRKTVLGDLFVLRIETSTTYQFFNSSNLNFSEGIFKRIEWYACGYGLIYFRHSREETLNRSFSSRSESSIELLSFTPQSTNESHVRYIMADMQLGQGVAIYRDHIMDEETAEAVRRWDAGMRAANIQAFERKNVNGQWLIVYVGTQNAVNGQNITLAGGA